MAISVPGAENATLMGRVLDYEDVPVGGLSLELRPTYSYGGTFPPTPPVPPLAVDRVTLYATTDDNGAFTFEGVPGNYELNATGNADTFAARTPVTLAAGEVVSNFVFRVHRKTVEVFGSIRNEIGEALANVMIRFRPRNNGTLAVSEALAITDEQGNYRLRIYPDTWTISPDTSQLNDLGYLSIATNITFSAPATNELNLVAARPPFTLSGTIVDQNGQPVPDLPISAGRYESGAGYDRFSTRSSASGTFSFSVSAGTWYVGYQRLWPISTNIPYYPISYSIEVASSTETNIVVPKITSRLNGSVKNSAGDPLPHIQLIGRTVFNGAPVWESFQTDTNGLFSAPVISGEWLIEPSAYHLGHLGYLAPTNTTVILNDSTNSVEFVAITPPSTISGFIRDENGVAITNYFFVVHNTNWPGLYFNPRTDAQGRYSVGVSPGKWFFQFAPQTNSEPRVFIDPIEPVDVPDQIEVMRDITAVRAPHRVRVSIRDENGASIAAQPWLTLNAYFSGAASSRQASAYFQNGTAEVYLSAGAWRLSLNTPTNYWPIPSRTLTVTGDVNLTLTARKVLYNSVLAGQFLDENNNPLTNLSVAASSAVRTTPHQSTDSEGRFSFNVAAGWNSVMLLTPGYLCGQNGFEVPEATNVSRVIRARKLTSTLTVNFNKPTSNSNDHFFVTARTRVGNDVFSTYAAEGDGASEKLSLFPGEWVVTASAFNQSSRRLDRRFVTISAAEHSYTIDVPTIAPTATIRGRAVDDLGEPITLTSASAYSIAGGNVYAETGVAGGFRFTVTPGGWGIDLTTSTNLRGYTASFIRTVAEGQDLNLGEIVMPRLTASALIQLRTPSDATANSDHGFHVYADRSVNGIRYRSFSSSYTGDILMFVTPAEWEFSFSSAELANSGFAPLQPVTLNIPHGRFTKAITLAPTATTLASPWFSIGNEPGGKPRLRLHVNKVRPVEIESSTDLGTWKFHNDEYVGVGFIEIPSDIGTNQVQFFRAIVTGD